ncbi:MAG: DAK2 domain-containing protein, partial [Acidimicrobiales bacterium]
MNKPGQVVAGDLRDAMRRYSDALASHREAINRLNVYPVPDGDTGTNMALTVSSVVSALDELGAGEEPGMGATCKAIMHGALMGARGNSGLIVSQILRGLAETFVSLEAAGPKDLATGLARGAESARQAVTRPVEGTILTVSRSSGAAAGEAAGAGGSMEEVLDRARVAGAEALARTPEQLPALAQAGVVDAGGAGYLLLLDAFLAVAAGRPLPEPPETEEAGA